MHKAFRILVLLCLFLGLHEGYLALKEGETVKHIFPYRIELYTQTDEQLLRSGTSIGANVTFSSALY